MFSKYVLRVLILSSFSLVIPFSTSVAEEASSCDIRSAGRVLSFGSGFGVAKCKNSDQRGLLIFDERISADEEGVIVQIESKNPKLIKFWTHLYYSGLGSPYYTDLLELGRNYYIKGDQGSLKELLDYIETIRVRLEKPRVNTTTMVKCESSNRNDQYCETGIDFIDAIDAQISVSKQHSKAACVLRDSFHLFGTEVWVSKGCRATFAIQY